VQLTIIDYGRVGDFHYKPMHLYRNIQLEE
jgi:hypothetical protein